jgi:hypothetical protein
LTDFLQLYGLRERIGDIRVCNVAFCGKEQAMGQQLQPWLSETWRSETWRSENGQTRWLSMLIDAMERVSRPEFRAVPCEPWVLAAVRAQLARPASSYVHGASQFGLRN